MLKVRTTDKDGMPVHEISGNGEELILFYIVWQEALWSGFLSNLHDTVKEQAAESLCRAKCGEPIHLAINESSSAAVSKATATLVSLGVEFK